MSTFVPRLDILPTAQCRLWPELKAIPNEFVLYGGTALAVRLGHRQSFDFDLFSSQPLNEKSLYDKLHFLADATPLQRAPDTLVVTLPKYENVQIAFFGGLSFGRIGDPERATDNGLQVASPIDLFATKLRALIQRVQAKDYLDIAALIESGIPLAAGLAAAKALSENQFPPLDAARALTYYQGGDLHTLSDRTKTLLTQAVRELPHRLPELTRIATTLHIAKKNNPRLLDIAKTIARNRRDGLTR